MEITSLKTNLKYTDGNFQVVFLKNYRNLYELV
jgi:hypothetical protein